MNTKQLVSFCAALTLCGAGLFSTTARADIIVNGTPGQPGGSFVITTDITFTIKTAGTVFILVLDENVPSYDGSANVATFPPGTVLSYNINGGNTVTGAVGGNFYVDNTGANAGDMTANDSYAVTSAIPVNVGDKVTLLAQTLPFTSVPAGFNTNALGTFKGQAFLTNAVGGRLSDLISVNRSTRYAEIAVELYNLYAGMGQTNLALHHFFDNISLSLYYFHFDSGDQANAEFNFYKFKGLSLKYLYQSQGKPKLGRYFQFLNLGLAHKRYWILKGNPRKGQLLYIKYRTIALLARR